MTHLRAVAKKKRAPRLVTCEACRGARVEREVTVTQRDGRQTLGVNYERVDCERCNSTGLVLDGLAKACCCSGPAADRCEGCANARRGGSEVHNCRVPSADEIAFEQEMLFAPSPRAGAKTTAAAHALGNGVGERSGQRGNR